jgi:hypothetical protein
VLIPPDAGKRKGARPGWNGGIYAFMRRVLATDRGRNGMIEPVFAHTKFNRDGTRDVYDPADAIASAIGLAGPVGDPKVIAGCAGGGIDVPVGPANLRVAERVVSPRVPSAAVVGARRRCWAGRGRCAPLRRRPRRDGSCCTDFFGSSGAVSSAAIDALALWRSDRTFARAA